jgi:hypothetical protein
MEDVLLTRETWRLACVRLILLSFLVKSQKAKNNPAKAGKMTRKVPDAMIVVVIGRVFFFNQSYGGFNGRLGVT